MSSFSQKIRQNLAYRALRRVYYFRQSDAFRRFRQRYLRQDEKVVAEYLASSADPKLQIGSGENSLVGWLNTDFFPETDSLIHLDATTRFPFDDNIFELIFTEHVIEHLPLAGGINMVREAFRTLRPGGRLRVSTPPINFIIDCYERPQEPANRDYLDWHFSEWNADAPARDSIVFANDFVRMWGHLFIYDEALLRRIMQETGFANVQAYPIKESGDSRLKGLENDSRMPPGLLQLSTMTLEGVKPAV